MSDRALRMRVAELEQELAGARDALIMTEHETQQVLGKALGYPPLYPEVSDIDDGTVCVGDHVSVTLAAELARKYKESQEKVLADGGQDPALGIGSVGPVGPGLQTVERRHPSEAIRPVAAEENEAEGQAQ